MPEQQNRSPTLIARLINFVYSDQKWYLVRNTGFDSYDLQNCFQIENFFNEKNYLIKVRKVRSRARQKQDCR